MRRVPMVLERDEIAEKLAVLTEEPRMSLPTGWTREKTTYGLDTEVLIRPMNIGGGCVSIDWKRRVFAGGDAFFLHPDSDKTYAGKGWRIALLSDAVAWLEDAMTK